MTHADILKPFGLHTLKNGDLPAHTPIDGAHLGDVLQDKAGTVDSVVSKSVAAFKDWRRVPAPLRGEFVRLLGERLRAHKENLGKLVTLESGKIYTEGLGEVQEMIDICDFAVGLSRQLYGLTIQSERPGHHMREVWQPLGPVGIISAFNFPVAVWSWNAALALVCGDSIIWKPSEKTPLTALACQKIFDEAVEAYKAAGHDIPDHLSQVLIGGRDVGEALVDHRDVSLISATGSTRMGRAVAQRVGARLGKHILELGGNNATIVMPSIELDEENLGQIAFGAVGTAGQRCTTLRRLIVHADIYDALLPKLQSIYEGIQSRIGDPLDRKTLVGPLIDEDAVQGYLKAVEQAQDQGGKLVVGGSRVRDLYVQPALIEMPKQSEIVCHETFAPILYVLKCTSLEEGIALNNAVPQGLSSSIMTNDVREAELFTSGLGSDCGIANVNIGTSGAEIGGAFGGEKETGGGRESGSDSWRQYMRRQTQTIRYQSGGGLAQGVKFDL